MGDRDSQESGDIEPARPSAAPIQLLLVENHEQLRDLWAEMLLSWGLQVTALALADEARELIASGRPIDLLFSDIRMPGQIDGLELARWVHRTHPSIGIVLQTGSEIKLRDSFRVLLKPVDPAELYSCLQQALASSGKQMPGGGPGPSIF